MTRSAPIASTIPRFALMYGPDDPRGVMQARLLPWLAKEDWREQDLVDWLQGYALPPGAGDGEPFECIMRGLPEDGTRAAAQEILAGRVAQILDAQPDERRPGERPERVLYNVLMLAAALAWPSRLNDPLLAMLERGRLSGKWNGLDIRGALLTALMANQTDDRLDPLWKDMLDEKAGLALPGTAYDGFRGALLMPPFAEGAGEPALDSLGYALRRMAEHLDEKGYDLAERAARFRRLIESVEQTYPDHAIKARLITRAAEWAWPEWAINSLPLVVREEAGSALVSVLLGDFGLSATTRVCAGRYFRVGVGAPAEKIREAETVSLALKDFPWVSRNGLECAVREVSVLGAGLASPPPHGEEQPV